jgi:hypothetical protein
MHILQFLGTGDSKMPILRSSPSLAIPAVKPGLIFWASSFDPANNGTQPANASAIATLPSKFVSSVTLNQGTGANQPTYVTNAINGKPCIRLDGTNDSMQSNAASFAVTSAFSMHFIARLSSSANINQCLFSRGASSATPLYAMMLNRTTANGGIAFWNGSNWNDSSSAIVTTTDFNLISVTWDGSNLFSYINGTGLSAFTGTKLSPSSSGGNFVIGGQGSSGTTNFFNGDFLEILISNLTHSATDVSDIARFYSNFYGLNF